MGEWMYRSTFINYALDKLKTSSEGYRTKLPNSNILKVRYLSIGANGSNKMMIRSTHFQSGGFERVGSLPSIIYSYHLGTDNK
jgi:hypothetical protein